MCNQSNGISITRSNSVTEYPLLCNNNNNNNIGDLTVSTGFHGKLLFFALLHKYPLLIGSLEISDRAESGISRNFEKSIFW